MNNNQYDAFFWLSFIANICQVASYEMNVTEVKNDDIMQHLQKQDQVLDEQTNIYLKKIIEQNKEIIQLLKER